MKKIFLFFLINFSLFSLEFEKESYIKNSLGYKAEIIIPKMIGGEKKSVEIFNKKMKEKISEYIFDEYDLKEYGRVVEKSLNYKIYKSKFGVVSVVFDHYEYTGGAHGISYLNVYLVDEKTGKIENLKNYLSENEKSKIIEKIKTEIKKNPDKYFSSTNIDLKYSNIYFKENKVVVVFSLYSIAPYCYGMPTFEFTKNDLK